MSREEVRESVKDLLKTQYGQYLNTIIGE